jgi:hypothetical protein
MQVEIERLIPDARVFDVALYRFGGEGRRSECEQWQEVSKFHGRFLEKVRRGFGPERHAIYCRADRRAMDGGCDSPAD